MKQKKGFVWMIALMMTGCLALISCATDNDEPSNVVVDENGVHGVKPEFVISIPRTVVSTRMDNNITQNLGVVSQFRGLDNIRLIPFDTEPTVSTSKLATIINLTPIYKESLASAGKLNYKVYADQFVPVGTSHFLFYAKAIDGSAETEITTQSDKFHYGYLKASGLAEAAFKTPSNISFSLEQVCPDGQTDSSTGDAIVAMLNSILAVSVGSENAPNDKWETANHIVLASLYQRFTSLTTCSSFNVARVLGQLYNSLGRVAADEQAYALAAALREAIAAAATTVGTNGEPLVLKPEYQNWPSSAGMPEGVARIRWNGATGNFVAASSSYSADFISDIEQYAYPAALWYYVATPLKASKKIESPNYNNEENWNNVIKQVYASASNVVENTTQSVALQLPAQYGVGRLETRIEMGLGTFYDAYGQAVNCGSGFKLKGLLIGGQNSVGYDFTCNGNENLTIYDREITENIVAQVGSTTVANQTLALETKSNQIINVALELVNGGSDFQGADGIIPAGGVFYLPAQLNPASAVNYVDGELDKIFMQDHVTKLTITIHNGGTTVDRNNDGHPDEYVKDENGVPIGVDSDGDGEVDPYDIDGDGTPDDFITDPDHGGPGWDTDGDGEVDLPVVPDEDGKYPDVPNNPDGLGNATTGVPDLTSPFIELGTSVNLEWQEGLILNPGI